MLGSRPEAENIQAKPGESCGARKQASAPKSRVVVSKGHKSQLKNPQWPKLDPFEQQNKVELDYNPKYKYLCIHSATKQLTYSTDQSTEKRQITHVKDFQVIYVDIHPQEDGA